MAKPGPSRLRPLTFWFTPITRSPAQKSACKDLRRNGQDRAITSEATYTPTSNRAGSRSLYICESPQYLLIYVEIF
ncbi:ATP-dependent nuclease subunit B [Lacticaseibacillus rhamnosus]|nr:ATP-dependent nuclease subunit B [Lacticaseibacillus rhamnosus]